LNLSISRRLSTVPTAKSLNTTRLSTPFKCLSHGQCSPERSHAPRTYPRLSGRLSERREVYHPAKSVVV